MDMLALFQCLLPHVTATTLRQLSRMALAMLVMPGRVTMLGISRWAGKGGSYRTIQRLFSQALPWAMLFWVFFRQHVHRPDEVYLLAGDEVVVTKAGNTPTVWIVSSPVCMASRSPGLAFFAFSLGERPSTALPSRCVSSRSCAAQAEKAARKAKAAAKQQTPANHKAPSRPSEGQQEQTPQRRAPHARVIAYHRHARCLAATDRRRASP